MGIAALRSQLQIGYFAHTEVRHCPDIRGDVAISGMIYRQTWGLIRFSRDDNSNKRTVAHQVYGTAAKEVQDTSCRESGGVPQFKISPKIGGYRGLIESISAVSIYWMNTLSCVACS